MSDIPAEVLAALHDGTPTWELAERLDRSEAEVATMMEIARQRAIVEQQRKPSSTSTTTAAHQATRQHIERELRAFEQTCNDGAARIRAAITAEPAITDEVLIERLGVSIFDVMAARAMLRTDEAEPTVRERINEVIETPDMSSSELPPEPAEQPYPRDQTHQRVYAPTTHQRRDTGRIKHAILPREAQLDKTYWPAVLSSIGWIFSGTQGYHYDEKHDRAVCVRGELRATDAQVLTTFLSKCQDQQMSTEDGRLCCYTSWRALYNGHQEGLGAYGGTAMQRMKESIERLRSCVVTIVERDKKESFAIMDAPIHDVERPSGQRLCLRLSRWFTDRIAKPDRRGLKPVLLAPIRRLRGKVLVTYLGIEALLHQHVRGSLKLATLTERLNIKAPLRRVRRWFTKLLQLDGLPRTEDQHAGLIRVTLSRDKLDYRCAT